MKEGNAQQLLFFFSSVKPQLGRYLWYWVVCGEVGERDREPRRKAAGNSYLVCSGRGEVSAFSLETRTSTPVLTLYT